MLKFDFAVQTREGQKIASIVIMARDRADAERKLCQMYRHCHILHCNVRDPAHERRSSSRMADAVFAEAAREN